MSWLISRIRADRVLECHVAQDHRGVFEHAQHEARRRDLEERRVFAHVRVPDDHVQAAESLRVGVRFVAGVDDRPRPGRRGRNPLPDVLRALGDAEDRAPRRLEDFASTSEDLSGDEEWDQHLRVVGEVVPPARQVVLVAPVRVAGRVGVVLEQVDDAAHPFVAKARLRGADEAFEDPLPCLVVRDEIVCRVTLWRRVLRVAADVQIEPCTIFEEDIRRSSPAHDPPEQHSRDLVGA